MPEYLTDFKVTGLDKQGSWEDRGKPSDSIKS